MEDEHDPLTTDTVLDSFDDVELGPLVGSGGERSDGFPRAVQHNLQHRVVGQAVTGAVVGGAIGGAGGHASPGVYSISTSPQFIDFEVAQTSAAPPNNLKDLGKTAAGVGSKPSSRHASFSLLATSRAALSSAVPPAPPPLSPPVSTAALSFPEDAEAWPAAANVDAVAEGEGGPGSQAPRLLPLGLITAPVQVPMCSVLFCVVSGILALVFFILFMAHHDQFEETGCLLLLNAASAVAGPASLTLASVRDPATLVCLGKAHAGTLIQEDSLAALLGAHSKAFHEAHAQLSFTPAGSTTRWSIALEVKGVAFNTTAGSAAVQVEDWEEAAAADAGTMYPGTEAFESQFGAGAPLGQPLLVFRLEGDDVLAELGS